jgi:small-conductance mechanosensitive channel
MNAISFRRGWLLALLLALASQAQADTPALEARAQALREQLATPSGADSRDTLLRRQLLTSLERRQDLARARDDARRLAAAAAGVAAPPPPVGLVAVDALRREIQQLDETLQGGRIRLGLLEQERAVVAAQLEAQSANLRREQDSGTAAPDALTRLQAQVAESQVAETDLLIEVVGMQQQLAQARRALQARRLAAAANVEVTASDTRALQQGFEAREANLRLRLANAEEGRERARSVARATPGDESAMEALANFDIDIELSREALADLVLEREAWALTLRYRQAGDAAALVEARERGPALRARLQRRREFLGALSTQILGRLASMETEGGSGASPGEAASRERLHAVLAQRLQRVQAAMLEERQMSALLERLRDDFDRRANTAPWTERLAIAGSELRAWLARGWNFELFTVDQAIEVEGRSTHVAHAVTVGKLVKAPLLLLLGGGFAWRLTGWGAGWLQRRRGIDEARVRLVRRWVAIVLVAGCTVASLVLAGIPLAAFAFVGGAVAIGAGIGTQTLFKNLLSGVLVLIERPFRLGDVIEVNGLRGTVVDIDLRASVLRDDEGAETLVPNSSLIEQNVRNMTSRSRRAKQSLAVDVDPRSAPRAIIEAMRAAAGRHGQLLDSPAPEVLLEDCADGSLRFALHYWLELKVGVERKRVGSDLRLMILSAFEEAGISLATPSRCG